MTTEIFKRACAHGKYDEHVIERSLNDGGLLEIICDGGEEIVLRKLPMGSIDADLLDLWVEVSDE